MTLHEWYRQSAEEFWCETFAWCDPLQHADPAIAFRYARLAGHFGRLALEQTWLMPQMQTLPNELGYWEIPLGG